MKIKHNERGVLALEASIALVIFMFLMLFLYSFFVFFEARNEMAHVLLQTTNSLGFDALENESLGNSGDMAQVIRALAEVFGKLQDNDSPFSSKALWMEIDKSQAEAATDGWRGAIYVDGSTEPQHIDDSQTDELSTSNKTDENNEEDPPEEPIAHAAYSSELGTVVQERFYAYFANGDMDYAAKKLDRYHISNLSFAGTKISSKKLTVVLTYDIEFEFNVFNLGKYTFQQSCCSKLWY